MENNNINSHQQIIRSIGFLTFDNFHIVAFRNLLKDEITRLQQRYPPLPLNSATVRIVYSIDKRISMLKQLQVWCDCFLSARRDLEP